MDLNGFYICNWYKYFYIYFVVENMNKLFVNLDVFIFKKSEYMFLCEDVGVMIMEEFYVNNFFRMFIIILYFDFLIVY